MKKKDWRKIFIEWLMKRLYMDNYHVAKNPPKGKKKVCTQMGVE